MSWTSTRSIGRLRSLTRSRNTLPCSAGRTPRLGVYIVHEAKGAVSLRSSPARHGRRFLALAAIFSSSQHLRPVRRAQRCRCAASPCGLCAAAPAHTCSSSRSDLRPTVLDTPGSAATSTPWIQDSRHRATRRRPRGPGIPTLRDPHAQGYGAAPCACVSSWLSSPPAG